MNREMTLAGAIALVLAISLLVAALVPGVVARPREEVLRPGRVDIREMNIAPGPTSGATATLSIDTRLTHDGNPSENVTLQLRAIDLESGLVETTRRIEVEPLHDDREVAVPATLAVARQGGYRIEAVLYQDGRRVGTGSKRIQGLDSLTPAYAETSVTFHRFGSDMPSIEYAIADVTDNRTTLDVSAYLTNTGDEPAGDLRMTIVARQADSNIVADRTEIDVGEIEPGRTATPGVALTVPEGYNYYLDAVLWKDGVIVGTARSAANLDPTKTVSVDETTEDVGLEVSDFEDQQSGDNGAYGPEKTVESSSGQPGFGVAVALVALLGAILLFRRNP